MLKFLWQHSLLIQIKIKLVSFYYSYLQHPQILKSQPATGFDSKYIYIQLILAKRKQSDPTRSLSQAADVHLSITYSGGLTLSV